jgi:cytochrome P450
VAICNHAFHHNPAVWGDDHNVFKPERWETPETAQRGRFLMHFGLGGRQCIGKTVAQTNIYKLTGTLLRLFEFQLADCEERAKVANGEFYGRLPELISVGISDLKKPLLVTAKIRE